jgi:hypothetical protein
MKLTTKKLKELIKEELNEMALSDEEMMKRMGKLDQLSYRHDQDHEPEMQHAMGSYDPNDLLQAAIQFFEDTLGAGQELSPEMEEKVAELMKKAQMALGYA